MQETVKIGDVIAREKYYEETQVTFFEIISTTKTLIVMREIEQDFVVTNRDECQGLCTPKIGCFSVGGELIRKKMLRDVDGHITFASGSYEHFSVYSGGSKRCSWGWSYGPILG